MLISISYIAVIASYVAVYYLMSITGSVLSNKFGEVIPKIGYLVVAFIVYSLMTALAGALRRVKEIPILGGLDRLLGGVLGGIESAIIIYIVEFITGFDLFGPAIAAWNQLFGYIQKTFINN